MALGAATSTRELVLLAASAGVLKIVAKRGWRLEIVGLKNCDTWTLRVSLAVLLAYAVGSGRS